jgi:uncharacterized protein
VIKLSETAIKSPKFYVWMPVLIAFTLIALAAIPTLTGKFTSILSPLMIDTDPESMLAYDDPVRVTNREEKKKFVIDDLMVVGITNKTDKNGVFNPTTLSNIHDLASYAKSLQWQDENDNTVGVVSVELISPANVDHVEQGGLGSVKFNWLMRSPPTTEAESLRVREKAQTQPILNESLISTNGRAIALYIPMTSKDVSYKISKLLKERFVSYQGNDEFFITGLATAQDVFGVEMFQQMAIATPMAMMLIMSLLWFFFRNIILILSPLIVANLAVMITMALMSVTGHSIHIMSSMIPIFIMPIAVLDGVHILSEFYDRYPQFKDRKKALRLVMQELSKPMLLTTITTAIGFAALNLIPLPPLQDFGTFVSIGVILAWVLTMTLIPAYIMLMPERKFAAFGTQHTRHSGGQGYLARVLPKIGDNALHYAKPITLLAILLGLGSLYGVNKLIPNDNPMKWFGESHEIRQADKILNGMFAGSYMAYLSLKSSEEQAFKNPDVLNYINDLQLYLSKSEIVGKTIAVTEVIKIVHRELFNGEEKQYRIPDTSAAVAQTLLTFQNSHRPTDLWHYVTPDYQEANIWFQLKSGDNQDMIKVENRVDRYFSENPPPVNLEREWFGMTHINVIWQDHVTVGVVKAFSGSFLIIMVTLMVLFRSFLWGLLAMVPLSFTVTVIYGVAGLISGNLDTPLAILTSVSIGLAVDYAIHFISRSRHLRQNYNSWKETIPTVFGEPSRAITRNVIVVGVGFLPLLLTPLIPYQMVGILLSSILVLSGIATLVILPALIYLLEKQVFNQNQTNLREASV